MKSTSIALVLIALTPAAFAHPGHGTIDNVWAHYAFEPIHGLALVVVILAAAGLWRRLQRR